MQGGLEHLVRVRVMIGRDMHLTVLVRGVTRTANGMGCGCSPFLKKPQMKVSNGFVDLFDVCRVVSYVGSRFVHLQYSKWEGRKRRKGSKGYVTKG